MTREEVIKILTILKANYQNLYRNISKKEAEDIIELYQMMFKNCDYKLVNLAVAELINTFQYPPTIADIKNKMYELSSRDDDKSTSELWDKLLKAIRNGTYGYEKEFEELPMEVKEFVREPFQLHELASIDSNTIHTVVKGQFLKQVETIKQRQKEINMMLPETRKILLENAEENKKEISNIGG